jgi:hypothetical protein
MLTNPHAQHHTRQINVLRGMIKGLESQMVEQQAKLTDIQNECRHTPDILGEGNTCAKCGLVLGRVHALLN